MDTKALKANIERWARENGASHQRAGDYGDRAESAYNEVMRLALTFANDFNQKSPLQIQPDPDAIAEATLTYNRELLNIKMMHGISLEDRIDTNICAGLWFCCLGRIPIFRDSDGNGDAWDMADMPYVKMYNSLVCRFAFYYAFRVLRGHYKNFQESELLVLLAPLRKYLVDHFEELLQGNAGSVAIFLAISLFDKNHVSDAKILS